MQRNTFVLRQQQACVQQPIAASCERVRKFGNFEWEEARRPSTVLTASAHKFRQWRTSFLQPSRKGDLQNSLSTITLVTQYTPRQTRAAPFFLPKNSSIRGGPNQEEDFLVVVREERLLFDGPDARVREHTGRLS